MTDKQLNKMGIHLDDTILKPNRYWCDVCDSYIIIPRNMCIEDLLIKIHDIGYDSGITEGKKIRSQDIWRLLNNEDIEE